MQYDITDAVPHPDHTGEIGAGLTRRGLIGRGHGVLPGGIDLTWPNEVDFSANQTIGNPGNVG